MLIKYTGKYVKIYVIIKITFTKVCSTLCYSCGSCRIKFNI